MEKLMQYVWEHRLWNPAGMATQRRQENRVIDPGLRNDDAGPDFFINAKIEIDGYVWAGQRGDTLPRLRLETARARQGHDLRLGNPARGPIRTTLLFSAPMASAYRRW